MLCYNGKPMSNSRSIGIDSFCVPNFTQTLLQIDPTTCRKRILRHFEDASSNRQSLNEKSTEPKLWNIPKSFGLDKTHAVTAVNLDGQEEAFSNMLNRFCTSSHIVILLYLGPDTRTYYTRARNIVIELNPGDLVFIGPQTDVFYTRAFLELAAQNVPLNDGKALTVVFA